MKTRFIPIFLIMMGILASAASGATISGHVYAYQTPNVTNNLLTTEMQEYKTTQEYLSNQINNYYTQYTHFHVNPNFFYFSCEGLAGDCSGKEPTGGEVYVDDFNPDGSQVQLFVHTPWNTWENPTVNKNTYITYSTNTAGWEGDTYIVYVTTFVGVLGNSGVIIRTQLMTGDHSNPAYFVTPFCIGLSSHCSPGNDYASMPEGIGVLQGNRSTQAIYINTTDSIPDLPNVTSFKLKILAGMFIPGNGGYITISQPTEAAALPNHNRINPPYTSWIYLSLPNGNPTQWYEITSFTANLTANPIFSIGIGENVAIYDTYLEVTYNATNVSQVEQPLQNVVISGDGFNTTTDVNGNYTLQVSGESSYPVTYNGFASKKAGVPYYGETKILSFSGNTTGNNVWLNETINVMTGQLVFNNKNSTTFGVGEQMNVAYMLFHSDRTNFTYTIDLYKPIVDYSSDMVLDASIVISNDSGNWLPNHDKSTLGTRLFNLNYTAKDGSAPIILAQLTGQYGALEPNGTISTDKALYNYSETALINYSTNVNGRILLTCPICNDYNAAYDIVEGDNQTMALAINSPLQYGLYFVWLQYNAFGNWNSLAMTSFIIAPNQSYVSFDQSSYVIGDSMLMSIFQMDSGYLLLKDSNNAVKENFTGLAVNAFSNRNYGIGVSDPAGTWTAELYDSTGTLVATATATVISTAPTVTPTPLPTTDCPSGANICSGVAWTPKDTYQWIKINMPMLGEIIFIVLILTGIYGVMGIFGRK